MLLREGKRNVFSRKLKNRSVQGAEETNELIYRTCPYKICKKFTFLVLVCNNQQHNMGRKPYFQQFLVFLTFTRLINATPWYLLNKVAEGSVLILVIYGLSIRGPYPPQKKSLLFIRL